LASSNGLASLCRKHITDQRRYGSIKAIRVSTRTVVPYAEIAWQLLLPHRSNEVVLAALQCVNAAMAGQGLPKSAHTFSDYVQQHGLAADDPLRFLAGWLGVSYWALYVSEEGLGDQKAELYQTLCQALRFMHGGAHHTYRTKAGNSYETTIFPPRGGTLYTARWLAPRLAPLVVNSERSITARLQAGMPPEVKMQKNMKAFSDALRLEAETQADLPLPKQRGGRRRLRGPRTEE
jgi:hypothetical protein